MFQTFSSTNFDALCDKIGLIDPDLNSILHKLGYPPMWTRPNTLETLLHIILEQQVSLASALAALKKLKERILEFTPENILRLSDQDMRTCFISRQKMGYLRGIAHAVLNGELDLIGLESMEEGMVREQLTKLKGVGTWTADVYLMFVLRNADIFPLGDIAVLNSMKKIKQLAKETAKEELAAIAEMWRPYRTLAAYILWHDYLSKPGKKALQEPI